MTGWTGWARTSDNAKVGITRIAHSFTYWAASSTSWGLGQNRRHPDEHYQTIDDYNALVRDWNKYLPRIDGEPRNVSRPLAASEVQVVQVLKLSKKDFEPLRC